MVKIASFLFAVFLLLGFSAPMAQDSAPKPSKKELFLRARDVLKTSLESGDTARAGQALDYLKTNVEEGAPLTRFEEYLAEMETGRYERGIELYADMRRVILDSAFKPNWQSRASEDDPLSRYLYRNLSPFDSTKADSLHARVVPSDISDEYKDLYRTLLYSELIINKVPVSVYGVAFVVTTLYDTTNVEHFLTCARDFVGKYPQSTYTRIFKEQTIPYVEERMKPYRDFYKDPFKHKYYTGGLGVFVGQWLGFMTGDAMDYFHSEMGSSFIGEISLQFGRISLNGLFSYGIVNHPVGESNVYVAGGGEDETVGLTLGYTVFDSRWLKAEPFAGVGNYNFMWSDADISTVLMLGVNADVRLFATKPKRLGGISFALIARFKYMMQFGYFTNETSYYDYKREEHVDLDIDESFMSHQFSLSLGLYLW
jgi:hypothetical protein